MDKERIAFENEILDKLAGKIFLLQDQSRKREVAFQTFLEVYNYPAKASLNHYLLNI